MLIDNFAEKQKAKNKPGGTDKGSFRENFFCPVLFLNLRSDSEEKLWEKQLLE